MYGPRGVMIPKMPALGLLLEYPVFEAYNRRITTATNVLTTPTTRNTATLSTLKFTENLLRNSKMNKFIRR
jgi:hypothetical protein